jgi:hypothetical protein
MPGQCGVLICNRLPYSDHDTDRAARVVEEIATSLGYTTVIVSTVRDGHSYKHWIAAGYQEALWNRNAHSGNNIAVMYKLFDYDSVNRHALD